MCLQSAGKPHPQPDNTPERHARRGFAGDTRLKYRAVGKPSNTATDRPFANEIKVADAMLSLTKKHFAGGATMQSRRIILNMMMTRHHVIFNKRNKHVNEAIKTHARAG